MRQEANTNGDANAHTNVNAVNAAKLSTCQLGQDRLAQLLALSLIGLWDSARTAGTVRADSPHTLFEHTGPCIHEPYRTVCMNRIYEPYL